MKIGLFGGTFDPPHIGHLILAGEARNQLALNRILWVLTPDPPHKLDQVITPLEHRLAMLHLMLDDSPEFELSRIEIDRPGPHYAVDTVQLTATQYPGSQISYIMGGDSLRDLPTWHRPADFLAACNNICVMRRSDDTINLPELEEKLPGISTKVIFLNAPLHNISSSELRRRILQGKTFRYYLHLKVYGYIQQHQLYR